MEEEDEDVMIRKRQDDRIEKFHDAIETKEEIVKKPESWISNEM